MADLRTAAGAAGPGAGRLFNAGSGQRWFALRFLGQDSEIRLDLDPHPEFDAWRWAPLAELPQLAAPFKHRIYQALAESFAPFSVPPGAP